MRSVRLGNALLPLNIFIFTVNLIYCDIDSTLLSQNISSNFQDNLYPDILWIDLLLLISLPQSLFHYFYLCCLYVIVIVVVFKILSFHFTFPTQYNCTCPTIISSSGQ